MKIIYSCLISLALISCSNESALPVANSEIASASRALETYKSVVTLPSNPNNPYDYAGAVYISLFDAYFDSKEFPRTVDGIIGTVSLLASNNSDFESIRGSNYLAISTTDLNYLLLNPESCASWTIANSNLSVIGKASLLNFINTFIVLCSVEESDVVLYNYVVDYETTVVDSVALTATEKMQILTTTSIARYSACRNAKKPKKNTDPDWDILIANIVGGAQGSGTGIAEAITLSLVSGIAQNTL